MDLIRVTHENLEREHICCAIAGDSGKKWDALFETRREG